MAISFRQCEIFCKVAELEHVTKASEQLLLSQSAVSMAIAELEKFAGAPLFERRGRRLLLNDRGRQVLPEVREVLAKMAGIEQFLNESTAEPVGELKVGASTTIGNYLLPLIVGEFSRHYPRASALLQVGNTLQIELAVESGECDLGLIEGPAHLSTLTVTPWKRDELVVIAGQGHPLAESKTIAEAALEETRWIMREKGSGTREIFEAAMQRLGAGYTIAMELGHTEAIKKAVEAGLGVGCLSRMAVQRELDHGWLVEISSPLELTRTLTILTRESAFRTRLLTAYLALLEQSGDVKRADPGAGI
ncbi:MAG TPA: LysR substrate-binding domain-containing protein [Geomonas sp.]|nr:LysR substrate-binding domain-containing protein [Geomonas sp.]